MKTILLSLLAVACIGSINADVSELSLQNAVADENAAIQNTYLPPQKPNNEYLPPTQTNVNMQYLPPQTQEQVPQTENVQSHDIQKVEVISEEPIREVEAQPAHELKEDGYHYKKPARFAYRIRRDVTNEEQYLPPQEGSVEDTVIEDSEPAHMLTDNGYAYKTQKRVVYRRNRRDVAHLPKNSYLAPLDATASPALIDSQTGNSDAQTGLLEPSSDIIDNSNGYDYNAPQIDVNGKKRRYRRDVSHVVPNRSYLAPLASNNVNVDTNVNTQYLPPSSSSVDAEAAPAHELLSDGYHYKTNRRVVFRHF